MNSTVRLNERLTEDSIQRRELLAKVDFLVDQIQAFVLDDQ